MSRRQRPSELPIPAAARRDPDAVEAIRVWFNRRGPHCVVRPGIWAESYGIDEPTGWATQLADIVRQLADGLAAGDREALLRSVGRGLISRLDGILAAAPVLPERGTGGQVRVSGRGALRNAPRELPLPRGAARDREGYELLRLWFVGGNRYGGAKLDAAVGKPVAETAEFLVPLLSEMTRRIAEALLEGEGRDVVDTLRTMRRVLAEELVGAAEDPGEPTATRLGPPGDGLKACTPLRKLLDAVRAHVPEPHHTGRAYFRAWKGMMPTGIPVPDGPGDELSVTWCDGEWCLGLPELIGFLRRGEEQAGDEGAMECYRRFVGALEALEAIAEDGVIPRGGPR